MFISVTMTKVIISVATAYLELSVLFDAIVKDVIVGGITRTSTVVVTDLFPPVSKTRT